MFIETNLAQAQQLPLVTQNPWKSSQFLPPRHSQWANVFFYPVANNEFTFTNTINIKCPNVQIRNPRLEPGAGGLLL
jgi:hypothetical protein